MDGEGLDHVRLIPVGAAIKPYQTEEEYLEERRAAGGSKATRPVTEGRSRRAARQIPTRPTSLGIMGSPAIYAGDLFAEVHRYARLVAEVARQSNFDVIHAHDWMTYPAGLSVAALTGKPLVVHIHSTEFDRSGANVNQRIYDIERAGLHGAQRVICVSRMTRDIVTSRYGVPRNRSAASSTTPSRSTANRCNHPFDRIEKDDKIVLFLGRITMQKGPEYFLAAAKKVLEVMDNVKFVMAGSRRHDPAA